MEPTHKVVYALQTSLDRAIDQYKKNLSNNIKLKEKDKKAWQRFLDLERGKVKTVASLQNQLNAYRKGSAEMSQDELEDEGHESARLGDHMRAVGMARPSPFWDAHAIISGNHAESWALRVVLAECEMRIDDPHNGCWLPKGSKYAGRKPYEKAVPHSRIHRYNYYFWLNLRFAGVGGNINTMINRLRDTRRDLLYRTFPPEVMLPKGKWKEPYDNLSSK
jgi:hypothetical protein